MKKGTRRGFSLLETIIGFCILSSAAVVFFQTVHKFKKETVFFSEHLIAFSLQEKIIEQCYQETEVNPYGLHSLGMADASEDSFSVSTHITDGQTVFFREPAISPQNLGSLHSLVKDNFNLIVDTKRQDGLFEVNSKFAWSAKYGSGKSQSFCKVLAVTGKKEAFTNLDLDGLEVENRILQEIFAVPDVSVANLNETLLSIGAQELVMSIGHIHYSCFDILSSGEFMDRCRNARSMESNYNAASEDYAKCSQMFFDIARDMLHLMVTLQPRIKSINDNLPFLDQIPAANQDTVKAHLTKAAYFYQQVRNVFLASLLRLISRYERQMAGAFSLREQRTIANRIFNFYRIIYLNSSFCKEVINNDNPEIRITTQYQNFLQAMQVYFSKRDPALERLAIQEKAFVETDQLKQRYYIPSMVNDLFSDIDALATKAKAIENGEI